MIDLDETTVARFVGGSYDGLVQEIGWAPELVEVGPCVACRVLGTEALCANPWITVLEGGRAAGAGSFTAVYRHERTDAGAPRRSLYVRVGPEGRQGPST